MKRTTLTPLGLRVLGELVAATEPLRRFALARAVGVAKGSVTRVVREVVGFGYASEAERTTGKDLTWGARLVVTEEGRAAWAARDEQPVIELAAAEVAPTGLTPREWQVLAAIAQRADAGEPPAPAALAKALGVTRAAVNRHVRRLSEAGLVEARGRTTALRLALTERGGELRKAAPQADPLLPSQLADNDLPPSVGLTRPALEVLRFVVAEAREGRVPVYKDIAARCGVRIATILTIVETLERGGFIARRTSLPTQHGHRLRVTPLAVAVADGRIPVVSPQALRSARLAARKEPVAAPARPRRAGAPAPRSEGTARPTRAASGLGQPKAAPGRVPDGAMPARELRGVRATSVVLTNEVPPHGHPFEVVKVAPPVDPASLGPAVPAGFNPNAPRPIKHPGMPERGVRPPWMSASEWARLSSPRQRGAA